MTFVNFAAFLDSVASNVLEGRYHIGQYGYMTRLKPDELWSNILDKLRETNTDVVFGDPATTYLYIALRKAITKQFGADFYKAYDFDTPYMLRVIYKANDGQQNAVEWLPYRHKTFAVHTLEDALRQIRKNPAENGILLPVFYNQTHTINLDTATKSLFLDDDPLGIDLMGILLQFMRDH